MSSRVGTTPWSHSDSSLAPNEKGLVASVTGHSGASASGGADVAPKPRARRAARASDRPRAVVVAPAPAAGGSNKQRLRQRPPPPVMYERRLAPQLAGANVSPQSPSLPSRRRRAGAAACDPGTR
ncbi:hypothetical protein HPB50_026133 [Hyalomma asiaticum]|uniref:Uncharacterized protein n=1 Tax=Hyalomma asiaticum TaxID=266040 RepID=A0ACB7SCX3_HYAAI|nr:hypothetical protein HPB50_026133 [Hyalomma asiaticum]